MSNELKERIYACQCSRCRSLVWLIEECGAALQFSSTRAGRLCELAVVAAKGSLGMEESEVVSARREYANHLKIQLDGPVSDAEIPSHIRWAITNSNHNPDAKNRLNLGHARALMVDGRYFIGSFYEHPICDA